MTTITIRNLDESLKRWLQVRTALNGRSVEAEVHVSLAAAVQDPPSATGEDLGTTLHLRFIAFWNTDFETPSRQLSARPISTLDE